MKVSRWVRPPVSLPGTGGSVVPTFHSRPDSPSSTGNHRSDHDLWGPMDRRSEEGLQPNTLGPDEGRKVSTPLSVGLVGTRTDPRCLVKVCSVSDVRGHGRARLTTMMTVRLHTPTPDGGGPSPALRL